MFLEEVTEEDRLQLVWSNLVLCGCQGLKLFKWLLLWVGWELAFPSCKHYIFLVFCFFRRISSTEVFLYNFEVPSFIGRFSLLRVLGHSNIMYGFLLYQIAWYFETWADQNAKLLRTFCRTPIIPNGSLIKLRASIDWSRIQLVTNAARQISVPIWYVLVQRYLGNICLWLFLPVRPRKYLYRLIFNLLLFWKPKARDKTIATTTISLASCICLDWVHYYEAVSWQESLIRSRCLSC